MIKFLCSCLGVVPAAGRQNPKMDPAMMSMNTDSSMTNPPDFAVEEELTNRMQ